MARGPRGVSCSHLTAIGLDSLKVDVTLEDWRGVARENPAPPQHDMGVQCAPCIGQDSLGPTPRRNSGLCHVCTGGKQHKAQKENGLVSGL